MSEIKDRLDELEAQNERLRDRVDDLETKVPEATDASGRTITLPDLERIGLSRRQALQALALLAAGSYSIPGVIKNVRAADTSSGTVAAKNVEGKLVEGKENTGTVTLSNGSGVGAANSNDWDSASTGSVSVTFSQQFDYTPNVVATIDNSQTGNYALGLITLVSSVSTTGFTLEIRNYGSHNYDGNNTKIVARWVAL